MVPPDADAEFQLALQHHNAGEAPQAEELLRRILARQPDHAYAANLLGVIAAQSGRNAAAAELFKRAVELKPNWGEVHCNLGNALLAGGQFDDAIAAYRRSIAFKGDWPEAQCNLGLALQARGQADEAIAAYRSAIALQPNWPDAWFRLGNALKSQARLDDAIAAWRQAIALRPDFSEAHALLGNALKHIGQLDDAIAAYRQTIRLKPNLSRAQFNLAAALHEKGELDEAIAAYRQAIVLEPNFTEAHINLGVALLNHGLIEESIAACRAAVSLKADVPEAHINLGAGLEDSGRREEAIAAYRRAIALKPDSANAHRNLGMALLSGGDFIEGWNEYEWRLKCEEYVAAVRTYSQPPWDGQPLDGATVLLYAEQGFGDTIQFIRYVPLVAGRGLKVVIACFPDLRRLLKATPGVTQWLVAGDPRPTIDFQCPLASLPRIFATTPANIPKAPYLQADPDDAGKWQRRLAGFGRTRKVGLVWAGGPIHKNDRNRSTALAQWSPLARMPGVQFFSLQKGRPAEQAKTPPAGIDLVDWTAELHDFADTAALVANLDLVISVDTAVAHLAGAMGKPVWVLLPLFADWRWMAEREDTPWYPTMRLFRQRARGDWRGVIERVAEELASLGESTPAGS